MPGVRLPVDIIEHLERQGAVVAGAQDVADEPGQVERTQPREQPVVPAPLDHVHIEPGRVGQLHVEHLGAGYDSDTRGIVAPGQHVEAVQAQAERGMVGVPHDSPGMGVRVDEPTPCQRLVGQTQAAPFGSTGQRAQLLGGELVVVHGIRGHRRADQHRLDAKLFQHIELALGSAQIGLEQVGRDRLEVTKGLV
jgi:hypothetical protein